MSRLLVAVIPLSGNKYGSVISLIILSVLMLIPALSSILTRIITKEGFKKIYGKTADKYGIDYNSDAFKKCFALAESGKAFDKDNKMTDEYKEAILKAIEIYTKTGFKKFAVFSDDIEWCKKNLNC